MSNIKEVFKSDIKLNGKNSGFNENLININLNNSNQINNNNHQVKSNTNKQILLNPFVINNQFNSSDNINISNPFNQSSYNIKNLKAEKIQILDIKKNIPINALLKVSENIIVSGTKYSIKVWKIDNFKYKEIQNIEIFTCSLINISKKIFASGSHNFIFIWKEENGVYHSIQSINEEGIHYFLIKITENLIGSASAKGKNIKIWRQENLIFKEIQKMIENSNKYLISNISKIVKLKKDLFASVDNHNYMKFWKEENGIFKLIHSLKLDGVTNSLLRISDNLMAIGYELSKVEVWKNEYYFINKLEKCISINK